MVDPTEVKYTVGQIKFEFGAQVFCMFCRQPIANFDMIFQPLLVTNVGPFDTKACMLNCLNEMEV